MRIDPRRSYVTKVAGGVLLGVLLLGAVGWVFASGVDGTVKSETRAQLARQADIQDDAIDQVVDRYTSLAAETATDVRDIRTLRSGDDAAQQSLRRLLVDEVQERRPIDAMLYVNSTHVLASSNGSQEGRSLTELGYAPRLTTGTTTSASPATRTWTFTAPTNVTGNRWLVVVYDVTPIESELDPMAHTTTQVVDETGTVVLDTNGSRGVGTQYVDGDGVNSPAVRKALESDEEGVLTVAGANTSTGERMVVGYDRIDGTDWALVSFGRPAQLYGLATVVSRDIAVLVLGSGVVFLLYALVVTAPTLVSIRRLSRVADRISRGDYDVDIHSDREDEIGQLYDDVETIRDELREQVAAERAFAESLINSLPDVMYVLDCDGNFVRWNDRVSAVTGYDDDEVAELSAFDLISAEDEDRVADAMARVLDGEQRRIEARLRTADDGEVPYEFSAAPMRDETGEVTGLTGIGRDVSERKARERELARQSRALDAAPVGITLTDPTREDNPLVYVNDRFERMTGYEETDVLGRNCRFLQGPETDEEPTARMREAIEDDEQVTVDLRNYRSDGDQFWNRVSIAPVRHDGKVVNYVGFQQDITESKERERDLETLQQELDELLETLDVVLFAFDEEGTFLRSQGKALEHLGLEPGEAVGESVFEMYADDERVVDDCERALDGEVVHSTVEVGGRTFDVQYTPMFDDDGSVERVIGLSNDITALKRRERELERSNEALEQFAHVASHDLREPLRTVTNYLQLLERRYGDDLDADAEQYIDYAVDGANRMKRLIDDLLAYSRVDTRGAKLEPTDLNAVFERARENLEARIAAESADVSAGNLPTVHGDAGQLATVFQNLVGNGLKYNDGDSPTVRVDAERDGDEWVVTVSDDGIGIRNDERDRLFDAFERLHGDEYEGTGIGLALCRKIIDRHGGDIWVESTPGEGSTFYLRLPAAEG